MTTLSVMVCISLARFGFLRRVGLIIDNYVPGGVNLGFTTAPVAHDPGFPSLFSRLLGGNAYLVYTYQETPIQYVF